MEKKRQTILFIDDEQNVLNSLRRLLYDEPWELLFTDSGAKGLDVLRENEVDLVISDVRMPGMDGIAFLKQVKDLYPHIVRIFLSGYADRGAVVQALSEGCAQQLLSKPWRDEELKEVIRGALLQAEELKKKSHGLQKIINSLTNLPPMPKTSLEIRDCLADMDNLSIGQVADIIEQDTSISAELLRWANSALFGQRHLVDTVERAILVMGLDIVQGLVLSESLFSLKSPHSPAIPGFSHKDFQTHSMACGIAAKLLVSELSYTDPKNPDRAFTAGLLHDIGKLVEELYFNDVFRNIIETARLKNSSITEAEFELLGTTHEEMGSYLADWWSLPSFLINAIRWHHKPSLCNADHHIIAAVHVADILVHRFEIGASGNFRIPDVDEVSMSRFDLSEEQLASIKEVVVNSLEGRP
ncbi:MAG: HDOD domain-containing protein [Nitrospiraceae bacterium]|nr:MAG: HDOD domain-containing protein [Nitrospiraceae bacterium]